MEGYRSKRKRGHMAEIAVIVLIAAVAVAVGMKIFGIGPFYQPDVSVPSWVTQEFLTPNEYSRPQTPLGKVKNIVIHYVANPGTSAENNRNYFESLKDTHTTKASSHFIVGLEGEVIQCIPLDEYSYASNDRNGDTISVETCHFDETGQYTEATYQSMVRLAAFLCDKYRLTEDDLIRHYDITGKICPKYFVDHEDAWETFKQDVGAALKNKDF
ncbi:MAG: N-acetylmuramoyl-L-alanine amidase family protein [Lachnospiraceae bacterium]